MPRSAAPSTAATLDKMNAHVHQPVPPIRDVAPDVPEELAAILDRMLAKDPGDRFATPAEVAEALAPLVRRRGPAGPACGVRRNKSPSPFGKEGVWSEGGEFGPQATPIAAVGP